MNGRQRPRDVRWPVPALVAVMALAIGVGAQTSGSGVSSILGTLTGEQVAVSVPNAAPDTAAATLNPQGRLQVPDGARIDLRGAAAELHLDRGGSVRLCGPARVSVARGGQRALLITLAQGAMELRYAASVADSWLTPDFRIATVVPPQQLASVSANLAMAPSGTICLMNRGSALSVERLWDGAQRYVINGQSVEFSPTGAPRVVAGCPCASPAPAAVPTPAGGPAVLFPAAPALSVQGTAMSSAAPAPVPPGMATGSPAQPHHNFLVRFLRWLVGK